MKKLLTTLLITTSLLFAYNVNAQDQAEVESFDVLDIGGSVTHGEENLEGVIIELFEGNKVVDAITTKKNGKFKFTLMSGEIYTIGLKKKGYYTKKVSVNTRMPKGFEDSYKFMFDLSLNEKGEKKLDRSLVEYPAVLVAYDKKKDEFTFDKEYTKSYFEQIGVSAGKN